MSTVGEFRFSSLRGKVFINTYGTYLSTYSNLFGTTAAVLYPDASKSDFLIRIRSAYSVPGTKRNHVENYVTKIYIFSFFSRIRASCVTLYYCREKFILCLNSLGDVLKFLFRKSGSTLMYNLGCSLYQHADRKYRYCTNLWR